jgi:hypothetical protein
MGRRDIVTLAQSRTHAGRNTFLSEIGMEVATDQALAIKLDALSLEDPDFIGRPKNFLQKRFGWGVGSASRCRHGSSWNSPFGKFRLIFNRDNLEEIISAFKKKISKIKKNNFMDTQQNRKKTFRLWQKKENFSIENRLLRIGMAPYAP